LAVVITSVVLKVNDSELS